MYGGKTFSRLSLFLMNAGRGCCLELFMREYVDRNGSAKNRSKTSCKREAYQCLHADRFHTETFQSLHVNAVDMIWQ